MSQTAVTHPTCRWKIVGAEMLRGKHWVFPCECVCGTYKLVRKAHLLNGTSKSCRKCSAVAAGSLLRKVPAPGEKVHRLTVLGFARMNARSAVVINVRCDCGVEKEMRADKWRRGDIESCGCATVDAVREPTRYKNPGEAGCAVVFTQTKRNAANRDIPFSITSELFGELTTACCFYCGDRPSMTKRTSGNTSDGRKEFSAYRYNGLDRFDNTRGYVEGNVVPCCRACNVAKNDYTFEEFIGRAQRIASRFPTRKEA